MEPQFRFCTSADGTRIAYASYGRGPSLLYVMTPVLSIEAQFRIPEARVYFDALATRLRLIMLDRRGGGASARDVADISPDAEAGDIAAVAEAANLDSFTLFSDIATSPCAIYAQNEPERVRNMIVWYPLSEIRGRRHYAEILENWSLFRRRWAGTLFPDGPASIQRALSKAYRDTVSPQMAARRFEASPHMDFDELFAPLHMPVLLLQREAWARQETIQAASVLPNGQMKFVPGHPATPYPHHEAIIEAVFDFVGVGAMAPTHLPSGTSVILFTDIVDSTPLTERMGDAAFRLLSRTVDERVRAAMREHGGTPVEGKVLGDGVMGVFPSAAQAIAAARDCLELGRELPMHIGLHAGDVLSEGANVYGGAVNIASRICGLCAPGEILVSATVRDLARTSAGVSFEDRGEQQLKGIEEPVRVFAVP